MYRWLAFEGVSDPQLKKIWRLKIPMKIRVFLWQVIQDRLPTREQILIRKGPTSGFCPLCAEVETIDHLLFLCPIAEFLWTVIRVSVDWPANPHSVLALEGALGRQHAECLRLGGVAGQEANETSCFILMFSVFNGAAGGSHIWESVILATWFWEFW
ncbi:hypothetical protein ACQ4PT_041888 [Festuca glaucescens]